MELNASNERGIDVVRNRIKMFAQQKVTLPRGRHKIVILDEADAMTEAAQQALRRTMEIYSNTTRFALAANSSEKIIEPIQSRCAMLRYSRLDNAQVLAKLLDVCEKENVSYTEDGMEAIIFTAQGDMRQALNNLQVRNPKKNVSFLHGKSVPPRIFFSPQGEVSPRAGFTPRGSSLRTSEARAVIETQGG